jgi:hypothetical protein
MEEVGNWAILRIHSLKKSLVFKCWPMNEAVPNFIKRKHHETERKKNEGQWLAKHILAQMHLGTHTYHVHTINNRLGHIMFA